MTDESPFATRLAELRQAFDGSFAAAASESAAAPRRALMIRAGGARYLVRVDDLSGVEPRRRIVPLPGAAPALLGLAGVRSRLVAVFDLAALLGPGRAPPRAEARYLLACRADPHIGLAVDQVEGSVDLGAQGLGPGGGEVLHPHVAEVLRHGPELLGVLDVPSIVTAVRGAEARGAAAPEER